MDINNPKIIAVTAKVSVILIIVAELTIANHLGY